jgi:hypothetical protein
MKLFLSSAIVLLAFLTSSGLSGQQVKMQSVPLLMCSGLPCVDATVAGGRHLRLLIDTGDVNALLSDSVASTLGLELKPAHAADGKEVPGYHISQLQDLEIGDSKLDNARVIVTDLRVMTKNHAPDADGFLTYPTFKGRLLRLDFPHKLLSISSPLEASSACRATCGTLEYQTFGKSGPKILLTRSLSINGKPISAQIDTLFTGSLLVYPSAVGRLGLKKKSQSPSKAFFPYTDGGVEMIKGNTQNISFGSLSLSARGPVFFATQDVHEPDGLFDATVGLEVLKDSVVTFNFHDNWVSVAKP